MVILFNYVHSARPWRRYVCCQHNVKTITTTWQFREPWACVDFFVRPAASVLSGLVICVRYGMALPLASIKFGLLVILWLPSVAETIAMPASLQEMSVLRHRRVSLILGTRWFVIRFNRAFCGNTLWVPSEDGCCAAMKSSVLRPVLLLVRSTLSPLSSHGCKDLVHVSVCLFYSLQRCRL